jgi:pyruvate/2-oxoacid:ferredoxin oxidoreductase alpha subunit
MTPKEYNLAYKSFMRDEEVYYVSEHRASYDNQKELKDFLYDDVDIIIFSISITRFTAQKVKNILEKENLKIGLANILWIKPFEIKKKWLETLKNSKFGGIILDDDYEGGVASDMAYKLMKLSNKKVEVMGLKEKSAGFSKKSDNLPPNEKEIIRKINEIIKKNVDYKNTL